MLKRSRKLVFTRPHADQFRLAATAGVWAENSLLAATASKGASGLSWTARSCTVNFDDLTLFPGALPRAVPNACCSQCFWLDDDDRLDTILNHLRRTRPDSAKGKSTAEDGGSDVLSVKEELVVSMQDVRGRVKGLEERCARRTILTSSGAVEAHEVQLQLHTLLLRLTTCTEISDV
eukprot:1158502-Pelagomonas_calceolata.AAC.10